jgi:hypothetical protein
MAFREASSSSVVLELSQNSPLRTPNSLGAASLYLCEMVLRSYKTTLEQFAPWKILFLRESQG